MTDFSTSVVNFTITNSFNELHSERRFPDSTTIGDLKNKLELLTGASAASMRIELRTKQNVFINKLDQPTSSLREYSPTDGMIIYVIDEPPLEEDLSQVQKYEISDEAYESRKDSVLAWKKKQQLGRFNPEVQKQKQEEQQRQIEESAAAAKNIKVGDRCQVTDDRRRGTVKFVGDTKFAAGWWVGVQFDEPTGKHDGQVKGVRYFTCPSPYGSFVKPQDLEVGDFPELGLDDMDEI